MPRLFAAFVLCVGVANPVAVDAAQVTVPASHEEEIADAQAEKARALRPYRAPWLERLVQEIDEHLNDRDLRWHPFYGHAYPGAGLTLGVGYLFRPGDYETLDLQASRSMNRSTRAEVVFRAPHLARRRLSMTTVGGWAEGLEQTFYGVASQTSGGAGSSVLIVSDSSVSGSQYAYYQDGTGSVLKSAGNNLFGDSGLAVGTLTPIALQ